MIDPNRAELSDREIATVGIWLRAVSLWTLVRFWWRVRHWGHDAESDWQKYLVLRRADSNIILCDNTQIEE